MEQETTTAWLAERIFQWLLAGAFFAAQAYVATGGAQSLIN
jgi:hypothetical protein